MDRLVGQAAQSALELGGQQQSFSDFSLGARGQPGESGAGVGGPEVGRGLAAALRLSAGVAGNLCRSGALSRHLLPGGQLDWLGEDGGAGPYGSPHAVSLDSEAGLRVSATGGFSLGVEAEAP